MAATIPLNPEGLQSAWLICEQTDQTFRVDLDQPKVVIGRSKACDLILSLRGVSRAHCVVEPAGDGWTLRDENSSNGTFVNQTRIKLCRLRDGDEITLGPSGVVPITLTFHNDSSVADSDHGPVVFDDDGIDQAPNVSFAIDVEDLESQWPAVGQSAGGNKAQPPAMQTIDADQPEEVPLPTTPRQPPTPDAADAGFDGAWIIALFSRMGKILLTSPNVDEMLEKILDLTLDHLPAQRGSIWLYDAQSGSISPRANRNDVDPPDHPIHLSRSIVNVAVSEKQSLLVGDVDQDERFRAAASIDQMNIRSAMCAPMYYDGQILGFIYVDSHSEWMAFTQQHLEVLTALAVLAAVGLEQSRLRARN